MLSQPSFSGDVCRPTCRVGSGGFFVLVRLVVSGGEMFLGMGLCDTIPYKGIVFNTVWNGWIYI